MDVILEYISINYIWILLILIIILLAIIGWYAETTNFGQGKTNSKEEDDDKNIDYLKEQLGNKKLLDEVNGKATQEDRDILEKNNIGNDVINNNYVADTNTQNVQQLGIQQPINPENQSLENISNGVQMNFDPITGEPINANIKMETPKNEHPINNDIDKTNLESFDKKFNEIIPEKEIIDEGLLEDIENLTLDKTQKLDLSDIPDLDDVDLPRIKQMKTNDNGIWKF